MCKFVRTHTHIYIYIHTYVSKWNHRVVHEATPKNTLRFDTERNDETPRTSPTRRMALAGFTMKLSSDWGEISLISGK